MLRFFSRVYDISDKFAGEFPTQVVFTIGAEMDVLSTTTGFLHHFITNSFAIVAEFFLVRGRSVPGDIFRSGQLKIPGCVYLRLPVHASGPSDWLHQRIC